MDWDSWVTGGGGRPVAGASALSLAGAIALSLEVEIGFVWYACLVKFVEWGLLGERRWRGQEKPRISKPRSTLRVFGDSGPTSC